MKHHLPELSLPACLPVCLSVSLCMQISVRVVCMCVWCAVLDIAAAAVGVIATPTQPFWMGETANACYHQCYDLLPTNAVAL